MRGARCRALVFAGLALLVASCPALPAAAYCRLTTEQQLVLGCNDAGGPLRWQRRCFEIALADRTVEVLPAAEARSLLAEAVSTWTATRCGDHGVGLEARVAAQPADCDLAQWNATGKNVNVVAFVNDWQDRGYSQEALALTFVWHDGTSGEIFDADTMINLDHGPFLDCATQTCNARSADLGAVFTHELGHFFGLAHSQDEAALMNATYAHSTATRRALSPDDIAGICAIYDTPDAPACSMDSFLPLGGRSLTCAPAMSSVDTAAADTMRRPSASCSAEPARPRGARWARSAALAWILLCVRIRRREKKRAEQ